MRWMKKLLMGIYIYMGVFFGICLVLWLIVGEEPSSLIMGISAAVGVESVAAGVIRVYENKEQQKHEKEIMKYEHSETETDQP